VFDLSVLSIIKTFCEFALNKEDSSSSLDIARSKKVLFMLKKKTEENLKGV